MLEARKTEINPVFNILILFDLVINNDDIGRKQIRGRSILIAIVLNFRWSNSLVKVSLIRFKLLYRLLVNPPQTKEY